MTEPRKGSVGQTYRVPLSGTLLVVLVREFHLTGPALSSKKAKRYFRGQHIRDAGRVVVIEAIVPTLPFLGKNGWPAARILALAIVWYAEQ